MATEERVLCFERKLLDELGVFQGLNLEVEKYLPVVTSSSRLVYLNRSDAGCVHFGVVHVMHVANERIVGRRSGIVGPEFIPIVDAVKNVAGYESWSRLCLEHMELLLSKASASGATVPERAMDSRFRP